VRRSSVARLFCLWPFVAVAGAAQVTAVNPQIRAKTIDGKVTVVDVVPHFVSAVRMPEPVNSIAVGDPALFQVEHSDREPELVFLKALTDGSAQSNLLITTTHGRQFSLLLIAQVSAVIPQKVDFFLQYKSAAGFLIEPEPFPFPLIGQTTVVGQQENTSQVATLKSEHLFAPTTTAATKAFNSRTFEERDSKLPSIDDLLERQKTAPLPRLYGQRIEDEHAKRDRLRTGISEVLDGGDQVTVLFSVVNTSKHAILLMPPQVQLGGKNRSGKLLKHDRWTTAEPLPVMDFRLSRRRVGTGDRADGVVTFERPPYKQSSEQLFLQIAESGAVDQPALAPIGFGISSVQEEKEGHGTR